LIVTWDEHGGFYDHVVPPAAPAPGDRIVTADASHFDFNFQTCGPRVPAVIVSPYVEKNRIDGRLYDHTSILATVREFFGGAPFTARDAAAASLSSLLTLEVPRADAPLALPDPVDQPIAPNRQSPPPDGPVHGANLPGFLAAALRSHLVMAAGHERDAVFETVSRLSTRAEACDYIRKVEAMIAAHRAGQASKVAAS
jgi:phospholipase C